MIEIHINKDVGSYEAKFIGPFTIRQTICVTIAAPICWLIYSLASPVVSGDVAGFLMFLPACVAWVFGWTKPYGMRPEKFVQSVFINMMLAPANRKYKSNGITNDVVFSKEETSNLVTAEETSPSGKKKKTKKVRYKVSPDAVK